MGPGGVRTEFHISVTRTLVREGELSRHVALCWEGGRAFAVVTGLGLPRTWPMVTRAMARGIEEALEETRGKGVRGAARALQCAERARVVLASVGDQLIERRLPDAALVAALLDRGECDVVSAGPMRAYLHRRGKPQRLTSREEPEGGLLRSAVSHCRVALEPGDLLMFGSVSAFSTRAIAQVVGVLEADPRAPPGVIASLLTDPAGQAGVGAAAIVVRIE
jgi:hypothetical protein